MPAKKQLGTSQKLPASDVHAHHSNATARSGTNSLHSTTPQRDDATTAVSLRQVLLLLLGGPRRSIKLFVAVLLLFVVLFVTLSFPSSSDTVVVTPLPMPVLTAGGLKDQSSAPPPPPPKKTTEPDADKNEKEEVVASEPAEAKSALTSNTNEKPAEGESGAKTKTDAPLQQQPKSPSARSTPRPRPPSLHSHPYTWPTSSAFTRFVHEMVLEELGVELAAALYDPLFFDNAVKFIDLSAAKTRGAQKYEEEDGGDGNSKEKSSSNEHQQQKSSSVGGAPPEVDGPHIDPDSLFLIETNLEWAFRTVLLHPSVPAPLTTVASKLVMLKQTVSLGLARLARDGRLAQEWGEQQGGATVETVKERKKEEIDAKARNSGADKGLNTRKNTAARASRPFSSYGRDYLPVKRPIRSIILGFVSYAISFLQVIIDGESRMAELSDWARLHNNAYSKMLWERASAAAAAKHNRLGREKAGIPPHVDANDPIIHRHLDPLINLLQVITVGPIPPTSPIPSPAADLMRSNHSTNAGGELDDDGKDNKGSHHHHYVSDDAIDWAVLNIMSQSERMRSLANTALEKAISSSSHEGKGVVTCDSLKAALSAVAPRASNEEKVQNLFLDLLRSSSASTPKVFLGIFKAYERERETAKKQSSSSSSLSSPIAAKQTAEGTRSSTAAVLLVNILGYATAVWNNRIAVLDAIIASSASKSDEETVVGIGRGLRSAALTNRAQYALQYFSNSAYNKWNKYLVNGRFWNSIRPVVGCSSLMKLCEEPDGCRYLCNLNYLILATPVLDAELVEMVDGQHAKGDEERKEKGDAQLEKTPSALSTTTVLQYAHQAVGFGSNNEYDWELGLVDAFKRASPAGVAEVLVNAHAERVRTGKEGVAEDQQGSISSTIINQSKTTTDAAVFSFPNTIGRITVFDCTLKKWTPPTFLTEGAVGFAHASYCLGLKDVSPLPSVREANGDSKDGVAVVGFPSLRKFINSDGTYPNNYLQEEEVMRTSERSASITFDTERRPNPFLTRYSTRGLIARNRNAKVIRHSSSSLGSASKNAVGDRNSDSGQGNDVDDDVIVPSPLYVDYTTFDEISILKLDVEGFEHVAFPSFLRAELSDLHEHYYKQGTRSRQQQTSQEEANGDVDATKRNFSSAARRESTYTLPLVTFDLDAPDSPTISQLGMEFHRQGHKGPAGASYWGAMRAHYSLMQLVSKGFLMFAQEKNPVDYCCYEIALAHYRHFVRSEAWSSQR